MKKILVFNAGSSSIKFSLYEAGGGERLLYLGELSSIGSGKGCSVSAMGGGGRLVGKRTEVKDHAAAFRHVFSWITSHALVQPDIIGHRMVHGGPLHTAPALLTPELIHDIHRLVPYAPEHIPPSLRGWSLPPNGFQVWRRRFVSIRHSTVRCLRWRGFMRFLPRSGGRGAALRFPRPLLPVYSR